MAVQITMQTTRKITMLMGASVAALVFAAPVLAQTATPQPDAEAQQATTQSGTTQPSGDQNVATDPASAAPSGRARRSGACGRSHGSWRRR